MGLFTKKSGKDQVTVTIRITLDMDKLNEFRNRIAAVLQSYAPSWLLSVSSPHEKVYAW